MYRAPATRDTKSVRLFIMYCSFTVLLFIRIKLFTKRMVLSLFFYDNKWATVWCGIVKLYDVILHHV